MNKELTVTPTNLLQVLAAAAENPNVDVDKMDRILNMMERAQGSEAERLYAVAMVKAQAEIPKIVAKSYNTQTKSYFAKLDAIVEIAGPVWKKNGFALSFSGGEEMSKEGYIRIVAQVMHKAGHKEKHFADWPVSTKGPQGGDFMTPTHATASAFKYGWRNLTCMIFNIAIGTEDDDGNTATPKQDFKPLSADQVIDITDKARDAGMKQKQLLSAFGVSKVEELSAAMYDSVLTRIASFAARKT